MTYEEKLKLIYFLMVKCDMYSGKIMDMTMDELRDTWYPEDLDEIIQLGMSSCAAHRRINSGY